MAVITTSFVLTRLYANFRSARKLGWDDYFSLFALLLILTYTGNVIELNTTARHPWDVPLSVFADPSYSKRIYVLGMTFGPGLWFAKAAILMLYLRAFQVQKTMRFLIYFGLAFMFGVCWVSVPTFSYFCTPCPGQGWDLKLLQKCQAISVLAIVQGVFGVIFDIYIFVLPLSTIFHLNLPYRKKLGLAAVFMTAILAIIASVLSLYYRVLNWRKEDSTWNLAKFYIFVCVEAYVAIIVGCAPAIAALWRMAIINSKSYQSLRSLLSTLTTRSGSTEGESNRKVKAYSYRNGDTESLSHLKQSNDYELKDDKKGFLI